jgi:hypothetical protein
VGPLPTSELAGCPAEVELQQTSIIGHNADGAIWRVSALPGDNTAETNQDVPVLVQVIAIEPP